MRLKSILCLIVSTSASLVTVNSTSADGQTMGIPVMESAVYRANSVWSCCSPSYLMSNNESSQAQLWCANKG